MGRVVYNFEKQNYFIGAQLRDFLEEELLLRSLPAGHPLDILERFEHFCSGITPLVKHELFHEEREWRIFRTVPRKEIRFYAGRSSIWPYVPIVLADRNDLIACLRAVRIGPADNQHELRNWTIDFLRNRGYALDMKREGKGLVITISGSPYRLTLR